MANLPADVLFGKVKGRFLLAVGDTSDAGSDPDGLPPVGLVITFKPLGGVIRTTNPSTYVVPQSIVCEIDSDGNLLDPQLVQGVWLVVGQYEVGLAHASFTDKFVIDVTASNTALAPLDLTTAVSPGTPLIPTQYSELNGRLNTLEATPPGAAPDATASVKGIIQLAGDIGGTASVPTVPGLAGKAPTVHTHTASQVSDSTTVGRALLTAADALTARTAIGAGTSSFNGAYGSLTGLPTLGTAAATASTAYATAAQGTKADTAVQPAGLPTWSTLTGKPTTFAPIIGPGVGDAVAGNDSRLTNARTPTAHNTTHATGGSDALTPAGIGAATSAQGTKADSAVQPAGLTKAAVGLPNVDNTSDASKPISTTTQAALDTKAAVSGQFAVNVVAASGAAVTLPATFPAHDVTLTANCAITPANPTAGHACLLLLKGAFTPTWAASVKWAGGVAPTYASAGTLYHLVTLDSGTTWQGSGQAHS